MSSISRINTEKQFELSAINLKKNDLWKSNNFWKLKRERFKERLQEIKKRLVSQNNQTVNTLKIKPESSLI